MAKGYKEMLAEAEAEVTSVTPQEMAAKLAEDDGATDIVLVDIRDPRELEREGMIAGAFHAPRGMLEFWIDPESPYAKPVFQEDKQFVFFCAGGWRSALAADIAQEMGLKPVAHIAGGFGAWKQAGAPFESPEPRPEGTSGGKG